MEDFGYPPQFPEDFVPQVEKKKDAEAGKQLNYFKYNIFA